MTHLSWLLSAALVSGGCASGALAPAAQRVVEGSSVTVDSEATSTAHFDGATLTRIDESALPVAREAMRFNVPPSLWGHVVITAQGERRFVPCASPGRALPIGLAAENELARWLPVGAAGITVLGRVSQDRLEEVRYAALEGPGCARAPIEGDLRAQGNESFWSLAIDGAAARVRTPNQPGGVAYAAGAWSRGAG